MGKKTVRKTIFISNALMVLVTLAILLGINIAAAKVYSESIEQELKISAERLADDDGLENVMEDFTVHRHEFIILFILDGAACAAVLVVTSHFFAKRLVSHIMKPLDALSEGAERIRANNLTQQIEYEGDAEFENVCGAFNDMQQHILDEQEKNRKYEKARTDMIAGISHDLRTPLTAIRGTVKGLLDGVAKEPAQRDRFLRVAYQRTGDMDVLLNQLFYLSKLETGSMPLSLRTIGIASFVGNYVKAKQELLTDGAEEITAETNGIAADVSVDPEQLQRIFDNLFENSRKYAGVTPLKMKISLAGGSGSVYVCFSDNGAGVPEEKLPYLFGEFYRADESRTRKDGYGLGLYIVKYLVEAMGGSVRAQSTDETAAPAGGADGKGLSVVIEFPVKR